MDLAVSYELQKMNANQVRKQLDLIKHASEVAQDKMDYYVAHDDHILRAIEVVEEFLRKRHRLCYGGQAINAHLPDAHKIYDPEFAIPDYDFFTPKPAEDIRELMTELSLAGFSEISAREGMHEGTMKIYVEYVPVADITSMAPRLYRILSQREFRREGISYLDANTLRMLMYLELSRPRGEVTRWPKIFERLLLFNEYVARKQCEVAKDAFHGYMTREQVEVTLNLILQEKRVFAGGDLVQYYRRVVERGTKHMDWILRSKKPIVFYSPDPDHDAMILQEEFNRLMKQADPSREGQGTRSKRVTIRSYTAGATDMVPSMKVVGRGKQAMVFILHQTACHAYVNIPMREHKILRVASMDTLITLYFSLGLMRSDYFDMGSLDCMANQLIQISMNARAHPRRLHLPFISILCSGHQSTLPSLIRAKVQRIMTKKKNIETAQRHNAKRKPMRTSVKRNRSITLENIEQALMK